jgi:hypothetical protein
MIKCRERLLQYLRLLLAAIMKHTLTLYIVLSLFVTCHAQDALKITDLETRVLGATDQPLSDFRDLVRKETWREKWPDASGKIETRSVTAEIWTAAMQASLDAQGLLHIPARKDPYYLDGPLILKSGQSLTTDAQAEIRLTPGCNTCMVRNANTDGLTIQNVKLNFPFTPDHHLLAIGPKSQTYKYGRSEDPSRWAEIFSPDLDCTVRNLSVSGARTRDSQTDLPIEQVVNVIEQKLNPDYPKTMPKGGTGKGIWIR